MHDRLIGAIEASDIKVIYLWEDGDGNQDVILYKSPALKVLQELLPDEWLAGHQHFGVKKYKNSKGSGLWC